MKETNTHRDLAYCFKKGFRSPNMIKSAGAATLSVTRSKSPALCGKEARSSMIGWFKAWAEFQSGRLVKMDRRLLTVRETRSASQFKRIPSCRMADAEVAFNNCALEIIVPDSLLQLPIEDDSLAVEEWLTRAREPGERKQAFFGTFPYTNPRPSGSHLM